MKSSIHQSSPLKSGEISKKIADLRSQRKIAINIKDYDTAEKIDNRIEEINLDFCSSAESEFKLAYSQKLSEIIRNFGQKLIEIKNESLIIEKKIRSKINKMFESQKARHYQEIAELEKAHLEALAKERELLNKEYEMLLNLAGNSATIGDFEVARKLQMEAEKMKIEEIKVRSNKVEKEFQEREDNLFKIQKRSIDFLVIKLQDDLNLSKEEARQKKHAVKSNREAAIISLFNSKGKNSYEYEALTCRECINNSITVPYGLGASVSARRHLKSLSEI